MSTVVANADKVQAQYVGYFGEPVFRVLERPGRLCESLLRHYSVYGADIRSLNINVSVLAEANVACYLTSAVVRVWLDRIEVFLSPVQDLKHLARLMEAGWSTMADVDPSLVPVRHEVSLAAWTELENEDFRSYISRFTTTPDTDWIPAVRFAQAGQARHGSLLLEESDRVQGGLYVKSVIGIDTAPPKEVQVMQEYLDQLSAQLNGVNLHLVLGPDS